MNYISRIGIVKPKKVEAKPSKKTVDFTKIIKINRESQPSFAGSLADEKENLLDSAREYVEEEVRDDPIIFHSQDCLDSINESFGNEQNFADWLQLSDVNKQAIRKMFQEIADELFLDWRSQAETNGEAYPKLVVKDVEDGIVIEAIFE